MSSSSSSSSTNYHFGCSNENPSGYVGQTTTVSFYLYDDEGNHPNLSPSSCSVQCMDNGLQAGYRVNGTVLDVDLTGLEPGSHRFKVTLKTTKGTSHTKNYYYDAIENANDPSSFYVDYPNNIEIWNGSLNEVPFRIINRYSGYVKKFNASNPFNIDYTDAPSVVLDSYDLWDGNTFLVLRLKGISNTTAEGEVLHIRVTDESGNSYDNDVRFIVKPPAYVELADRPGEIILDPGQTVTLSAYLYSGLDGKRLYISPADYGLMTNDSNYVLELDYIDNTKIRFTVTNLGNTQEGSFGIRLTSQDGFSYENWFYTCTTDFRTNYYWLQFTGESYGYQVDSWFIVALFNRNGDNKLMKDIYITSTRGIIPSATIKDVNDYTYEYHFTPMNKGFEDFNIRVVCYDGTEYINYFGVEIN